jgi:hypothetical protein
MHACALARWSQDLWWETAHSQLRNTVLLLLADLPPELPILLLATSDKLDSELDLLLRELFDPSYAASKQSRNC